MQNRIGPYLYFDGMKREKTFGDRSFTIVVAAAYDAGIIGPEHNGIVVIDDNFRNVLIDQHMKMGSGYHGPSADQVAELKKIMAMDWDTFSHFVATHPRYTKTAEDINNVADPDAGDPIDLWIAKGKVTNPSGDDIRTPEMIKANDDSALKYAFPDKTREEMIVALANHEGYHPMNSWNRGFVVSWDIKIRGTVDAKKAPGYEFNEEFDDRWEQLVQDEGDALQAEAAESALRSYIEGDYTSYAADTIKAKFYTNGRSGGHLVLENWSGPKPRGWSSCKMAFDDREDYIDWLKGLSNNELVDFYGLVKTVDADTSDPTMAMNHEYAFIRQCREEDWSAEAAPAI